LRYACLVYFDPQVVFNQSPEAQAVLGAVGPHDAQLRASGQWVAGATLTLPNELRFLRQRLTQLDGQHTGVSE
jgi:hypothetical protein